MSRGASIPLSTVIEAPNSSLDTATELSNQPSNLATNGSAQTQEDGRTKGTAPTQPPSLELPQGYTNSARSISGMSAPGAGASSPIHVPSRLSRAFSAQVGRGPTRSDAGGGGGGAVPGAWTPRSSAAGGGRSAASVLIPRNASFMLRKGAPAGAPAADAPPASPLDWWTPARPDAADAARSAQGSIIGAPTPKDTTVEPIRRQPSTIIQRMRSMRGSNPRLDLPPMPDTSTQGNVPETDDGAPEVGAGVVEEPTPEEEAARLRYVSHGSAQRAAGYTGLMLPKVHTQVPHTYAMCSQDCLCARVCASHQDLDEIVCVCVCVCMCVCA